MEVVACTQVGHVKRWLLKTAKACVAVSQLVPGVTGLRHTKAPAWSGCW